MLGAAIGGLGRVRHGDDSAAVTTGYGKAPTCLVGAKRMRLSLIQVLGMAQKVAPMTKPRGRGHYTMVGTAVLQEALQFQGEGSMLHGLPRPL